MTTNSESTWARAENASRRALLIVCLGALAWGVGSIASVNLREAMDASLDEWVTTGLAAIVEHWVFQRIWLVFVLAPIAWLAGRFIGGPSALFVVPATLSGELLSFALEFLKDGSPFHSWEDVAGWALSLAVGVVPSFVLFARGAKAFEASQAESLRDAASRRAEYDAFVAKTTAAAGEGGSGQADSSASAQSVSAQNASPQNAPPQNAPPQNAPPQNAPPQNAPTQNGSPQSASPQNASPENAPPQSEPSK